MTADKQAKLAAHRLAAAEGISYAAARRRLRETAACGPPTGIRLPYTSLRHLVPELPRGQMAVLASHTSTGKTTMAVDIARHAAAQGLSVLMCCFHETRYDLAIRVTAAETGIPHALLRDGAGSAEQVAAAQDRMRSWPLRFLATGAPEDRGWDLVFDRARTYRPDLLIVDDLHSVLGPLERADEDLMRAAAERLASITARQQSAVLVCSQMSTRTIGLRSQGRPRVADVFVVRNTAGPTGTAVLGSELNRYRFTDLGRDAARTIPWQE